MCGLGMVLWACWSSDWVRWGVVGLVGGAVLLSIFCNGNECGATRMGGLACTDGIIGLVLLASGGSVINKFTD